MNENTIAQFSLMLLFSIAVFSCQSGEIVAVPKTKISFMVDSVKIYPTEQKVSNNFIFSPLTDLDKIWTVNTNNAQELDLSTGEWTALSGKYDEGFKRNVSKRKKLLDKIRMRLLKKLLARLHGRYIYCYLFNC